MEREIRIEDILTLSDNREREVVARVLKRHALKHGDYSLAANLRDVELKAQRRQQKDRTRKLEKLMTAG